MSTALAGSTGRAQPLPEPAPGAPIAGIDLGHTHERAADAWLLALAARLPAAAADRCWLATHWAGAGDGAHIALSVALPGLDADAAEALLAPAVEQAAAGLALGARTQGPPELAVLARQAAAAHAGRRSGRLVRFPGSAALTGTLPVAQVLARSAVDRVRVLAAGEAGPGDLVRTREHVRPTWTAGELVLLVQPASGGALVPFEPPDPTPCCADHD